MKISCSNWDNACIFNDNQRVTIFGRIAKPNFLKKKKQQRTNIQNFIMVTKIKISSLINSKIFSAFHNIICLFTLKDIWETSWKTMPTPIYHCIRRALVCALNYSSKHYLVLVLIVNSKKPRDPVSGCEILISPNWSPTDCHWDNWKTYI